MVHELADFERAADQCHLTVEQLSAALFAPAPAVFGHVAVDADGLPAGFALWFLTYSTWEGTHGIHLEDLYVRPGARGTGAGTALLAALAAICVDRGWRRLEWMMLDWNPAAGFYAAIGATVKSDWLPYRLAGEPLHLLAERASRASTGSG
ncbi:N-acetyltransferase family protein [Krasilnikovia sp. M28-CT-15]|uniref:GNAT family N-acetyltransferase n=1 Tax=Krasilnikovia sp. M28-CT-15 TaxID=3373540 RepID=UPI0038762922